jgi:hypothetical protein
MCFLWWYSYKELWGYWLVHIDVPSMGLQSPSAPWVFFWLLHWGFLDIYPEDVLTFNKDTCSTIFIVALFIIARSWKEPRCPATEEWIQKMWDIYSMEYYSVIKNNAFM